MPEKKMNQEFWLKKIDEIRNYLTEEINQDELMSKKHKIFWALNYIDHSLIEISAITGCVSISIFAPLVSIPIAITSSAIGFKICVITAGIKKYQSIIKKKSKKHDKIVLLAKSQLNRIKVLLSKALIHSNISHNEQVLINKVLKGFYDMKEEIKNPIANNNSNYI